MTRERQALGRQADRSRRHRAHPARHARRIRPGAPCSTCRSLVGLAFVAACLLGVLLVNPRELLSLVVTPPLVFFVATLFVELGRALGSVGIVQSLALGLLRLAVARRALAVRGLGRRARRRLAPRPARQRPRPARRSCAAGAEAPRPRQPFVPEPEGYFEPKVYGTPRTED